MDNIDSDMSDDEFDGYIDDKKGVVEKELNCGNNGEGVCCDVFGEELECREGVCGDVFGEECANYGEGMCSEVVREELD